jgi:hypothetical protein
MHMVIGRLGLEIEEVSSSSTTDIYSKGDDYYNDGDENDDDDVQDQEGRISNNFYGTNYPASNK